MLWTDGTMQAEVNVSIIINLILKCHTNYITLHFIHFFPRSIKITEKIEIKRFVN